MASSEGLASVEPWSFRQSFNIDSWLISDSFSHDSDIIAKALHRSISTSTDQSPLSPSSFFDSSPTAAVVVSDLSPPQTLSNVSFGSDPELAAGGGGGKRKRGPGVSGGKQTKRRSRVSSKKSQTTFITADAANFRQMVQQVTGAKFIGGSPNGIFAPLVKPEPHRLSCRLPPSCGSFDRSSSAVPTLDTSSFLSNHHQENIATDLGSVSAQIGSFHHQSSAAKTTTTTGNVGGGGGSAVELDSYPSFPTLESWTVM
ncbi:PREDICTED: calmodulin-binding protein 25-like [Camelina sativa]|uniref:Calmodulin-binding protein 25-like n=1 Tax=Camelina sativa TaxID=90675 RepID=A0ABM0ZIQ5_CAMSA|nr:PREDICTED: calmodulin-binding protein 25-like [Camelina sativa]